MATFERHLRGLVSLIAAEKNMENAFKNDFGFIRQYVLDILRRDPIIAQIMVNEPKRNCETKPFATSLVLDMSYLMVQTVNFYKNTIPFLRITRIGDKRRINMNVYLPPMPFVIYNHIDADAVIDFVRRLIDKGLKHSGCFVRSHQNEVYELRLHETKHPFRHLITIDAISDSATLSIDFRVYIRFSQTFKSKLPQPFPLNQRKMNWLAVINNIDTNKRKSQPQFGFTISVPELETELSKKPYILAAYRLLHHLVTKLDCYMNNDILLSPFYELLLQNASNKTALTAQNKVTDIMKTVLERMINLLKKDNFPFYWNTKINLLNIFENKSFIKRSLRMQLSNLYDCIVRMQNNSNLSFDEVQEFFGIEVNSEVFKVDNFSIFKSF